MKVAIMQPYFVPYIGYFQMIAAVDVFVIYDNIEYTKKGWINRNRILKNGEPDMITLPLAKSSDYETIANRFLADEFHAKEKQKLYQKIKELYRKAPHYKETMLLVDSIFDSSESNLFHFIHQSITRILDYLRIPTKIVVSSQLPIDHSLKAQEKVIALCKQLQAHTYINAIGGVELYQSTEFQLAGIKLQFIKSAFPAYTQLDHPFVPWLSIVDVLMFCGEEYTQKHLHEYNLLNGADC
jgi:hypothetical protein